MSRNTPNGYFPNYPRGVSIPPNLRLDRNSNTENTNPFFHIDHLDAQANENYRRREAANNIYRQYGPISPSYYSSNSPSYIPNLSPLFNQTSAEYVPESPPMFFPGSPNYNPDGTFTFPVYTETTPINLEANKSDTECGNDNKKCCTICDVHVVQKKCVGLLCLTCISGMEKTSNRCPFCTATLDYKPISKKKSSSKSSSKSSKKKSSSKSSSKSSMKKN